MRLSELPPRRACRPLIGQSVGMETLVSRWGEHGDRPQPASVNDAIFGAFKASATIEVACSQLLAWDLVANIERIGEFSPECIDARWLDNSSELEVGARFEGTNRMVMIYRGDELDYTWIRPCTVMAATRPTRFAYTVGDRFDATPASSWDFEIDATASGCRITQHFQHHPQGLSGTRSAADADPDRAEEIVRDRIERLTRDMQETLQRMKTVLESDTA